MEPLGVDDPERIGDYRLIARLGAGGMGRVFLGRGPSGDLAAVKVVHARFARRQDRRDRFAREIAAMSTVDQSFVAPVLDHDADAAEPWLATAYLPGLTLRQAVELHGPLPTESVRALGSALARALAAIHDAGVLHRDLKPSNLILTTDGPRIVDFGLARPEGAETITMPGSLLGTPGYIPPERIRDRSAGPPGDVFGFGAVLVYASTGEGPFGKGSAPVLLHRTQFEEPRLDALRASLTDALLVDVIESCLDRDPRHRPTARELAERLAGPPEQGVARRFGDDIATKAADGTDPARPHRSPVSGRTRRSVLALGVAGAVLAAVGPATQRASSAGTRRPSRDRTPLWTYESPDTENQHWFIRPTVAGNTVYLSSTRGLHALSCDRGDLVWTAGRGMPVRSRVAVERDTVFFTDMRLQSLHASDGTPRPGWQEQYVAVTGAPAAGGGRIHLCDSLGRLSAFDGGSGRRRWELDLARPEDVGRSLLQDGLDPVLAGGLIYVAPAGLFAVDPNGPTVKWRFDDASAAPVVDSGVVYTASADQVYALDALTGKPRWGRGIDGRIATGVALADGRVFVGDQAGCLHALDAVTGRPIWRFQADGPVRATPAAAAGTVLVGADNDRLYAIGTADGGVRWSHPVGRQTEVHTAVWRDRALVCVDLGGFCAFTL